MLHKSGKIETAAQEAARLSSLNLNTCEASNIRSTSKNITLTIDILYFLSNSSRLRNNLSSNARSSMARAVLSTSGDSAVLLSWTLNWVTYSAAHFTPVYVVVHFRFLIFLFLRSAPVSSFEHVLRNFDQVQWTNVHTLQNFSKFRWGWSELPLGVEAHFSWTVLEHQFHSNPWHSVFLVRMTALGYHLYRATVVRGVLL